MTQVVATYNFELNPANSSSQSLTNNIILTATLFYALSQWLLTSTVPHELLMWLQYVWGADDLHMVQLMPLPPISLASLKSRMVYLFGASLPRLSWKKGR